MDVLTSSDYTSASSFPYYSAKENTAISILLSISTFSGCSSNLHRYNTKFHHKKPYDINDSDATGLIEAVSTWIRGLPAYSFALLRARRAVAQPSFTIWRPRPTASAFAGTSLVMQEPAPM
jgi:hypothetical protein